MRTKIEITVTALLVLCAVLTTGLVIRRELLSPPTSIVATDKPVFLKKWRAGLKKGFQMGESSARVQLLEFADFECPFCATFHMTLKRLRAHYPKDIAVTFIHFPLPGHRFAEPAARAAECAANQGRFEEMHDALFQGQGSFGVKPWSQFASKAGVLNLAAFQSCVQNEIPLKQIDQGLVLGKELEVRGTPTIVINGWKFAPPPTERDLERIVKAVLAGEGPV